MAKIAFSKLKCKINEVENEIVFGEEKIMVKQYLPIQEKLRIIGNVVELAHEEEYHFPNPVKAKVFCELETIFRYTNITFTDKQKEDLGKLYDILKSSGLIEAVLNAIPDEEYVNLVQGVNDTIEALYRYENSAMGILDGIKSSYDENSFSVEKMQQALQSITDSPIIQELRPLIGLE